MSHFKKSTAIRIVAAAFVFALFGAGAPAWSQQYEDALLLASDGLEGDYFGNSVAVSGDVAVIGAPFHDDPYYTAGSAYVFRYDPGTDTWIEEARIVGSDTYWGDRFGWSVAISGDVILVGAPHDDLNSSNGEAGAAYLFRYDAGSGTWLEEQKIVAFDRDGGDVFGNSVAISGGVAAIGAPNQDDGGVQSGSAYIFRYDSGSGLWSEEQQLFAPDPSDWDNLGERVAISNNVAIAGAPGDDDNGTDSGSAYLFRFDAGSGTWSHEEMLYASDGEAGDVFGFSVAASNDRVLIGATGDDDNGTAAGAAYVFAYDSGSGTWSEEGKILPVDGDVSAAFGTSVALDNDRALIGAYRDDAPGFNSGSAYTFAFDSGSGVWNEEAKLVASTGADGDELGLSVGLSGNTALAGAGRDDDLGPESGAVFVYDLTPQVFQLDIKANDLDSGVVVLSTEKVVMTIDVIAGDQAGTAVDVWVVGQNTTNGYWWSHSLGVWTRRLDTAYLTGSLVDISDTVLDAYLPPSQYKAWLAVETAPNGLLDIAALLDHDVVDIEVLP